MLMKTPPQSSPDAEQDLIEPDICILGAGPGGIALALAASAYGQSVVLIEKHKMGGTSLNYGAVPGVALAAAAERAHAFRTSQGFGIAPFEPSVDRAALAASIMEIVGTCAPNASVERLTGLGVQVILGIGRFADPKTVIAGRHRIAARRFVIATGSVAIAPDIAGLDSVPFLTTETIYTNRETIDHLIVAGAGASGVELAQAQRRLGARVTLIDKDSALKRYDGELAAVVTAQLRKEGVVLVEGALVRAAEWHGARVRVEVLKGGEVTKIEGSHLLIACGRRPAIDGLGLAEAKIKTVGDGIKVNSTLRTSNRRVYALGDAAGLPYATNRAHYHASMLARTLLFRQTAVNEPQLIPFVLHTDPEFAFVGLSEAEAAAKRRPIQVLRWPVRENVRAQTLRAGEGHIKVVADKRGRILGAGIAAKHAGELIQVWALAVKRGLTVGEMSSLIVPYPTLGELTRMSGGGQPAASSGRSVSRGWVKLLAKLG